MVTVGFADPGAGVQGVAIEGAGALIAAGGAVSAVPGFDLADVDGTACRLRGGEAYDVTLEPVGPPAELGPAARAWICRARGSATGRPLEGLGAIIRSEIGDRVPLQRAVTAWLAPELAVVLAARRPRRASGHGDEELHAALVRGEPPVPLAVASPRLSTTYDGDGLVTHCGIELWETEESEFAERYGALATAHGELTHADGARTRVAFLAWRRNGETGIGRYDITER